MHVGMSCIFQGFEESLSDAEVYQAEVHMADLAEPLGFQSIWGVEHHFTIYNMCPDIMQFLTFMAGRTKTAKLGSMVTVLPWHDPVRLAENILMLDNLSQGRTILGWGRGTGKIEYDGFGLEMSSARQTFKESAQAILQALETGVMEFDGEYVHQDRVELYPRPYASFDGRIYSATISPESAEIMAKLGTGVLIVPQKAWHLVEADCASYRATYRSAIGSEPPPPVCAGWVFVDESADRAEEMARTYIAGYWRSIVDHYEFNLPDLANTPGYEFHGQMYERLNSPGGMEKMTDFYVNLQPWGTPDQVYDKITTFCDMTGSDSFVGCFRYAAMPVAIAEANMRMFAKEVMPRLQKLAPVTERVQFSESAVA